MLDIKKDINMEEVLKDIYNKYIENSTEPIVVERYVIECDPIQYGDFVYTLEDSKNNDSITTRRNTFLAIHSKIMTPELCVKIEPRYSSGKMKLLRMVNNIKKLIHKK